MCGLLTVMCVALVVLRIGPAFGQQPCVQQCLPRCAQLLAHRVEAGLPTCCDCRTLCITSCNVPGKLGPSFSNSPGSNKFTEDVSPKSEEQKGPCSRGDCALPDEIWKNMSRYCGSCRTKRKPRAALREVALIARSVGIDLGDLSLEAEVGGGDNSLPQIWGLRLQSLTMGEGAAVTASVVWDSALPTGSCYLITWQAEETSAIRGNLLTNSTCTLLSLLPHTVYHVQVASVSSGSSSECLLVDTHTLPQALQPMTPSRLKIVAGMLAAMITMALISSVIIIGRLRRQTKDINQRKNNDHFKLYPPPITLFRVQHHSPPVTLQKA